MKTVLCLSVFLLGIFCAQAEVNFRGVKFVIGPSAFREGDLIEIDEVYATDDDFEAGDQVVVRGQYRLGSHEAAKLSLFVTQTEGDGRSQIQPAQQLRIESGSGPFELRVKMPADGYLHVTFYSLGEGNPFGGVYFGTREQMQKINYWTLDRYLANTTTPTPRAKVHPVNFTDGPSAFLPGDFIKVESVEASSDDFRKGDTVVVHGRYRLESYEAANMMLTVTQTSGSGKTQVQSDQQKHIERGSGDFELRITMPANGYLHLGFYPTGGKGRGSAYIGTKKQMQAIKDWPLEDRLK